MDDIRQLTTVFQDHTKFECVCEEDVNLYIACQYHEGLERKDEESRKEEGEIWTGSEEAAEDDEEWEAGLRQQCLAGLATREELCLRSE